MSKKHGAKGRAVSSELPSLWTKDAWVQRKAPRDGRDKKIQPRKQRFG